MKMKKFFLLAMVVLTGIASSCQYDDDELWDSVNNLADRVTALETVTKQMNSDLSAMQSIISALEKQVSVSSVEELADGYIIHFSDGTKATIKNGADGKDGANGSDGKDGVNGTDGKDGMNAPIIDVDKENGIYYWTITVDGVTTWLTDDAGNKLPVSGTNGKDGADGEDGKDGADGEDGKDGVDGTPGTPGAPGADGEDGKDGKDGITPKLKIDADGYWMVSYDNGTTYDYVLNADGEKVNAVGPKGDKGDTGATGSSGSSGSSGSTGATGAQGPAGPRGPKGEAGDSKFDATNPVKDNGDGTITIKLADGTEFTFAKAVSVIFKSNGAAFENKDIELSPTSPFTFTYEFPSEFANVQVEVLKEESVTVTVDESNRTVTVKQKDGESGGKVILLFYNGNQTITSVFTFKATVSVNGIAQANQMLIDNQSQKNLDVNVESISGTDNTIELPDTQVDADVVRTFTFKQIANNSTIKIVEKDATNAENYHGKVIIEIPDGVTNLTIDANVPHGEIWIKKGNVENLIALADYNTTIIGAEATVNNITVKQGNVRLEADAKFTKIVRETEESNTDVIYVIYEGEKPEPSKIGNGLTLISAAEYDLRQTALKGGSVTLESGLTLSEPLTVSSDFTLNLGGYTLTAEKTGVVVTNGSFTLKNGSLLAENEKCDAISIQGAEENTEITVTVEKDAIIKGGDCCIVTPKTNNSKNITINVAGQLETESDGYAALQLNGNTTGAVVNITDGSITNTNEVAVYFPCMNELNISGGVITGTTAVYHKSGKLTISGGTLNAIGTATDYKHESSGCVSTGDALVIEACDYPGSVPEISITSGTFNSANGKAIGYYEQSNEYALQNKKFITGGTFSDHSMMEFVAETGAKKISTIWKNPAENETMNSVLSHNVEELEITLNADATLNVSDAYIKLGGADTKSITIDGNNNKMTWSTNYWSRVDLANNTAVLSLKKMNLTSTGNSANTWNAWDVGFQCNVNLDYVTLDKAIYLTKRSVLNYVTIDENDFTGDSSYAIWIEAGANVDINNSKIICTLPEGSGKTGRGIKISDQYIDNPTITELKIKETSFKTQKKAAVLVGSKAGAEITWGEGNNIELVAEDKVNAVWIDEDYASYDYLVKVEGCTKIIEGYPAGVSIADADGNINLSTAEAMFWFAEQVNKESNSFTGKTINITADIDLKNEPWTPIGQTGPTQFMGTFDGQGNIISNLNIDKTGETGGNYSSGIFGWLNAATVKNVKVSTATIKGNHNVGVIAGYLETSGCTIENCHVTGATVECHVANNDANGDKAAVIVGHAGNTGVVVKDCTAKDSTVSAGRDAGQVVGAGKTVNVTGCSATNVTVTANGEGTGANIRNEVIGRIL